MMLPLLAFAAEDIEAETEEYASTELVYTIAFSTGDPEEGGHSWNFSRSFDDDWGVCTVREIQQAVIYEGIVSFSLHRTGMECIFDAKSAAEVGFTELRVTFEIGDLAWKRLVEVARTVFRDRDYFRCEE
jgi:hypothetical protein